MTIKKEVEVIKMCFQKIYDDAANSGTSRLSLWIVIDPGDLENLSPSNMDFHIEHSAYANLDPRTSVVLMSGMFNSMLMNLLEDVSVRAVKKWLSKEEAIEVVMQLYNTAVESLKNPDMLEQMEKLLVKKIEKNG